VGLPYSKLVPELETKAVTTESWATHIRNDRRRAVISFFKGFCPRCDQELCAGEIHGVQLDMCRACYGILLDRALLVTVLDVMAEALRETLDPALALEAVPDIGGEIICPRCRTTMDRHGYMDTKWVMIDSCQGCDVVWLDTDELGMISLLYVRSKMRAEKIQTGAYVRRSLASRVRSNHLGGAVQHFLSGGLGG
jgi:Zn-finger nucleic acid-binding protein